MAHRMFGIESEVAFTAFGARNRRAEQSRVLGLFMSLIAERNAHLPSRECSGIFLQTGGRLYVDCSKPEITTPEVVNPWDLCRYVMAGERLLLDTADALVGKDASVKRVMMTRCNVGYGNIANTWACHENYGHRADGESLPGDMIPHLVSRIVYSGAGGFDNHSPGVEFLISPRTPHLPNTSSSHSQGNRGIFHTKNESLSGRGYSRLHLLCGESNSSETSLWLKTAATALVVALSEAGFKPGAEVGLRSPTKAMRDFSLDPTLTAKATMSTGERMTAIEIQEHYLRAVRDHLDHPCMPPWAAEACKLWGVILRRLKRGPDAVARTLDWAMKLPLFQGLAQKKNIDWGSLRHWNYVLGEMRSALAQVDPAVRSQPIGAQLLASGSPIAGEIPRLTEYVRSYELDWDDLPRVLELRQELFELDVRFGELGEQGLFHQLDRAGLFEHHVEGVDNIEHAMVNPPAVGRAKLRGTCIQRFHGSGGSYTSDWQSVWDHKTSRYLDLSDPFAEEEVWHNTAAPQPRSRQPLSSIRRNTLARAQDAYQRGDYDQAQRLLEQVRIVAAAEPERSGNELLRLSAWVRARSGHLGAPEILDEVPRRTPAPLWLVTDYVCVWRFSGLQPRPEIEPWISQGEAILQQNPDRTPPHARTFREHQLQYLLSNGRLDEARPLAAEISNIRRLRTMNRRILARALVTAAEVHRRTGHPRKAKRLLDKAADMQRTNQFQGDLADITLTSLAKLATDRTEALRRLDEAKTIHSTITSPIGEARRLLLEARLRSQAELGAGIRLRLVEMQAQRPALAECALLAKVLDRWDDWTSNRLNADETGDVFWGV